MASNSSGWNVPTLAMYLCAAASIAILVLLWAPSFSASAAQAPATMTYAIAPLTWTAVALVIAAIGVVLGCLVPGQPAATAAVATLLFASCIVFWSSVPNEESSASTELAAVIAGSLVLPTMFGWLVGYRHRIRHAAVEPSREN
jgi:hypothetical protein